MAPLQSARLTWILLFALSGFALLSCGDDDPAQDPTSDVDILPPGPVTDASGDDASNATEDVTAELSDEGPPVPETPTYAGSCPEMNAGTLSIRSGDLDRQVILTLPDEPRGAPVLFVYHGNGSNAPAFVQFFGAARIASHYGTIVVTPSSTGLYSFEWPLLGNEAKELESGLFLDMLACLSEAWEVELSQVYTTGFSAGGLWSTWLTMHMADHLAAAAIFSGGTSSFTTPYASPSWPIPVLATHGGPSDEVGINFEQSTNELVGGLSGDGHLVVLCTHDRGHTIPWPIPDLMMPFLLSHSWQEPDMSFSEGLDSSWPGDCAVP